MQVVEYSGQAHGGNMQIEPLSHFPFPHRCVHEGGVLGGLIATLPTKNNKINTEKTIKSGTRTRINSHTKSKNNIKQLLRIIIRDCPIIQDAFNGM